MLTKKIASIRFPSLLTKVESTVILHTLLLLIRHRDSVSMALFFYIIKITLNL